MSSFSCGDKKGKSGSKFFSPLFFAAKKKNLNLWGEVGGKKKELIEAKTAERIRS